MLGFTLSKLNLLILVTALFAIISFFMLSLADIVVSNLAQQMANDYTTAVQGIALGDNICRTSSTTVPESIQYFGGLMPAQRFYYVLYIKRYPPEGASEGKPNSLIFQVASRREKEKIIATSSLELNATILLYDWDPVNDTFVEKDTIMVDPESKGVATKNSVYYVKEIFQGKKYLHIIACSSYGGVCERNIDRASCWLKECAEIPRESSCFPKPADCASRNVSCG